ncbi:hypothetical protein ACIA8G_01255 [Lentzea sp. NPDC051213]|uniref:hypothetical protein n=1 Tax=Lentzea sp. NPDC051213 TaxID=3364126 RepID=UPI0037AABEAF
MRWFWMLFGVVALAGAGLVVKAGLESADKLASVVGAAAGLLSLAVTVYATTKTPSAALTDSISASDSAGHSVTNSTVHGALIQVRDVKGDFNL